MPSLPEPPVAQITTRQAGDALEISLGGVWSIRAERPQWEPLVQGQSPRRVRFLLQDGTDWDSSLLLFLGSAQAWATSHNAACEVDGLPEKLRDLLGKLGSAQAASASADRSVSLFTAVGVAAQQVWRQAGEIAAFVGECTLSAWALAHQPWRFRWRDCLAEMQQCGAMALPIVSLISFLVGVTLAYTGAIILRQFGGDIWVADLIGLSMTREMGAMMTAIVLAGRTGAAFAAQLGNMKANEEIDALATLGVSPVDFLVLPRMVALALMMPLLALYANCLGILGGMCIASSVLSIPPTAYFVEMQTIVDLSDINTGLVKATTFGLIVGLAGCLRGMQADRSAAGVGQAATSAVVTGILLIIIADSFYAVLFNALGW